MSSDKDESKEFRYLGTERFKKPSASRLQAVGNKMEKPFEKQWLIKMQIYSKGQIIRLFYPGWMA